jgi:hypothetical protein
MECLWPWALEEVSMSGKSKKIKIRMKEAAYKEWDQVKKKKKQDMIEFLKKYTDIENVEELMDTVDNIDFIVREHPEIIDHETPTEKLLENWEDSVGDLFPEAKETKNEKRRG